MGKSIPCVFFVFFLFTANALGYTGGSGTAADPYQIATVEDLILLGDSPEDYNKNFILTDDIDLDPNLPGGKIFVKAVIAPDTDDVEKWFQGIPFTGVFDGAGHVISNFSIDDNGVGNDYLGLFGLISSTNAEIKNLGLENVNVIGSDNSENLGGLCGHNEYGSISHCYSAGKVVGGDDSEILGGLCGLCYFGSIINCYSTGTVTGGDSSAMLGGLCGEHEHGIIDKCYSTCKVTGPTGRNDSNYLGGLCGRSVYGSVSSCYSTGTITGGDILGGLCGYNSYNSIRNCYSTGIVIGAENSVQVGGLCGYNIGIISNCYSTGKITGGNYLGGLCGLSDSEGSISNCYYLITAGPDNEQGTPLTHNQMTQQTNFTDWDFNNIWVIWDGYDYPHFQWEPGPKPTIVFVDIPGGTFEMGDHYDVGNDDEKPVHSVTLDSFNISKYETTNAQYTEYLNAALAGELIHVIDGVVYAIPDGNQVEPYFYTLSAISSSQIEYTQGQFIVRSRDTNSMADYPVVDVSWYGAKAFCDYYGYRLPTEAEWEYAARGGYHDPYYQYPWGSNDIDCSSANYRANDDIRDFCNPLNLTSYPFVSPVGYYGEQGGYGLCDISGNVWEWCRDWYISSYYSTSPPYNPPGPDTPIVTNRILRGGCWSEKGDRCRVACRYGIIPQQNRWDVGFRVCISINPID